MYIRTWLFSILLFMFSPLCLGGETGVILQVDGAIGPAVQDYVTRGIARAEKEKAVVVIIELNTPGGLESSMRGINQSIINSTIPVIAYVAPPGARAASAGTFILYASHLAAMAPGTNIGAASPVSITGGENTKEKQQSTLMKKATQDASAYIRSLAQLRGRNAKWGESAVTKAVSLSAQEAKKQNVINDIANDYPDLLKKMDGRKVNLAGKESTVKLKDVTLKIDEKGWRYRFLSFITDPNIAYILMLVAMYGLFFELSNPGLVLPGVAGMIALLLVLYAFQLMPVNYVGLALIATGVGFMIAEVFVTSFGALGIGGLIAFVIGSIMLFDMQGEHYRLAWELIAIMSFLTLSFFVLVISLAVKSQRKKIVSGQEGLVGETGVVMNARNEHYMVRVAGEMWEAKCSSTLKNGDKVRVTHSKGLLLTITPVEKSGE